MSAARSATVGSTPRSRKLGGDRGGVQATFRATRGDRLGQGRVVDQADPFQPVERLGDHRGLEAAVLQPLPQLGPGARPGREQPEGGGVGGVHRPRPLAVQRSPSPAALACPDPPPPPDHHHPALRSP